MEMLQKKIFSKENEAFTFEKNNYECSVDKSEPVYLSSKDCVDSKIMETLELTPFKDRIVFTVPAILSKEKHKWKRNLNPHYVHKLPYFVFFVSIIQITVYYIADKRLKRALMYDTDNKKEVWRFITYMFLHTDLVHLGSNVVIQAFLGSPLEFEQGHFRCAAIYFGGGLAGSLGASVFEAHLLMAGASGGIYALLISQISHIVLNYQVLKYKGYRIVVVAVLTTFDVIYIFCHMYFFNNESPRIGWMAHVSGAVSGLLLGFVIFKGSSKWRKKFQTTSFFLLFFMYVSAMSYNFLRLPSAFLEAPS